MPRRSPLRAAIKTGRPQEWIKNVFVFAGLLFSGKFNQPHDVLEAIAHLRRLLPDLQRRLLRQRPDRRRARPQAPEEALPPARRAASSPRATAKAIAPALAVVAIAHRLRHRQLAGRPDGGRLRRRPGRLQPRPQADRDHRRDDAGGPLHPPRRRRRQRRRRPRLRMADPLHRHARRLPRLHQAPPGGGLRAARGHQQPARSSSTTRCPSSTRWSPWSPPAP